MWLHVLTQVESGVVSRTQAVLFVPSLAKLAFQGAALSTVETVSCRAPRGVSKGSPDTMFLAVPPASSLASLYFSQVVYILIYPSEYETVKQEQKEEHQSVFNSLLH